MSTFVCTSDLDHQFARTISCVRFVRPEHHKSVVPIRSHDSCSKLIKADVWTLVIVYVSHVACFARRINANRRRQLIFGDCVVCVCVCVCIKIIIIIIGNKRARCGSNNETTEPACSDNAPATQFPVRSSFVFRSPVVSLAVFGLYTALCKDTLTRGATQRERM